MFLAAIAVCALGSVAAADSKLPSTANLDGGYLYLGPRLGAIHRAGSWDSNVGVDVAVVRVREKQPLAALGVVLSANELPSQKRTRFAMDAIAGTRRGVGFLVGIRAGLVIDYTSVAGATVGANIGIWGHAGVAPFVNVGWTGGFTFEAGISIPLPLWRRR
jgi:hypothetical protein